MVRYATHFEENEATRSQAVLLEIMTILGSYREYIYLVGGWAPYFLLKLFQKPEDKFEHVGSIDIDLVIDFSQIEEPQYQTIVNLLLKREYEQRLDKLGRIIPFAFQRQYKGVDIQIDFLAGEYGGTGKKHRHQRIQDDLLARKARGTDILPQHHIAFDLNGTLPDGALNTCKIKVANVVSALTMKGITISERYKEKDAYDIYSLIAHYKEGSLSVLQEVKEHLANGLVREGMRGLVQKFEAERSPGPTWAAKFMEPKNENEAALRQAEIYNSVRLFVEGIGKLL
ncbi:MAG: nucleotidyl transferase AbiEii/AbiGii toxin family protein [Pseudomonadota bacterium]